MPHRTPKILMPLAWRSRVVETGGVSPADVVVAWCGLSPPATGDHQALFTTRRPRSLSLPPHRGSAPGSLPGASVRGSGEERDPGGR